MLTYAKIHCQNEVAWRQSGIVSHGGDSTLRPYNHNSIPVSILFQTTPYDPLDVSSGNERGHNVQA